MSEQMPPNVQRWEHVTQPDGSRMPVPIQFDCACGAPSCYGQAGRWYCLACWLAGRPDEEAKCSMP